MKRQSLLWAGLVLGVFVVLALGFLPVRAQEHKAAPDNKVEKMKDLAAECRKLEFLKPVEVRVMDMESLKKKVLEMFETEVPVEKMVAYEKAFKAFGLLPKDFAVRDTLINLYSEQIGGFYDPRTKELYVIDRTGSAPNEMKDINEMLGKLMEGFIGMSQEEMVMLHELVHALQDQHFNLLTLPSEHPDNDDLGMAVKALIEGDATYAMFEPVAKKMGMHPLDMGGGAMMSSGGLGGALDQVPEVLQQSLIFPYLSGAQFLASVRKKAKWDSVNAAFDDLPASTEQILHPEKYTGERDNPTTVKLPDLTQKSLPGWKLLLANVMGELNVGVILRANWPRWKSTKKTAAGWDGDCYAYFESPDGQNYSLAWFTTWDSLEDSTEFWSNYGKMLRKKKYPQHKVLGEGSGVPFVELDCGEGILAHLEMRDKDVLVVEGRMKPETLKDVVAELWKGTTKKELTKVERIEPPTTPVVTEKPVEKPPIGKKPDEKPPVAKKPEEKPDLTKPVKSSFNVVTPDFSISAEGLKMDWSIEQSGNHTRLAAANGDAVIDIRLLEDLSAERGPRDEVEALMDKCKGMLSPVSFGKPAHSKLYNLQSKLKDLHAWIVNFEGSTESGKELRGCLAAVESQSAQHKIVTLTLVCAPEHFEEAAADLMAFRKRLKIALR